MADCIGCGYCCITAVCAIGARIFGSAKKHCPALMWDEGKGRHFCKLVLLPGELGARYREQLYIGSGCSSTLFNEYREHLKNRTKKTKETNPEVQLDRYFKLFVHSLAGQWMSSDLKSLIVLSWKANLKSAGVPEEDIDSMVKEIYYILTEGYPSYLNDFFGKIEQD